MRTDNEIKMMFKDMDLDTEEKRSKFKFSFSYSVKKDYEVATFFRADTKTRELKEEKNAELE